MSQEPAAGFRGQQPSRNAPEDSGADAEEEALVKAPFQFRVGPVGGPLIWDDGLQEVDDAGLFGVELETVVARFLGFRLGGSAGTTAISRGEERVDAVQYLAELLVEGRLAVGSLREHGVVPFVAVGGGSLVHDPGRPGLITRSQSAFIWGAGVDVAFADRFGSRLEWRRVTAELQNPFEPSELEGSSRDANWIVGSLYWVF